MTELFTVSHIDHWISYLTYSPYATVFLLLTAGIWFIPLAEELALVTAGYLYYSDQVQLATILIVVGLGVFFGDFMAFWLGRRWIKTSPHTPFPVIGRSKFLERFKTWLDRHSSRALFWIRFLPGLRLPAHIVIGAHGMPVDTYIRITLFAVTIYVPIIFVLAYSFGAEIDAALVSVQRFGNAAWIILLVTIIVWSVLRIWITRQSLAEQNQEPS